MANTWFKFYGGEYMSDAKIGRLDPAERSCWITLLCLASMSDSGVIKYLSIEDLLIKSGIKWDPYNTGDWEKCQNVLVKFSQMKMIKVSTDESSIKIINWAKRQERTAQTPYERTKKYRELNYEKINARNAVKRALDRGELTRDVCEVCGDPKSEAHHTSYNREDWLKVKWLCKKHHTITHNDDAMMTDDDSNDDTRIEENRIEENNNKIIYSDDFLNFYNLYPRKIGKLGAYKKWETIIKKVDKNKIITGLKNQIDAKMFDKEMKFIKHPEVWLNKGCWDDEIIKKETQETKTKSY